MNISILIEGLKMPKSCKECKFWSITSCIASYQGEKSCPLIEVPEPHGRLIDADALPWYLANTSVKYATYEDWEMLCDAIATAPTVIPASEEGET